MTIERIFYCDGPGCERHVQTARPRPMIFFTVTGDGPVLHFCSWDCILKRAAEKPPSEVIPWGPDPVDSD